MKSVGEEQKQAAAPIEPDAAEEWRRECLTKLGFTERQARLLAADRVDHWKVSRALAAGCTHDQAVRIFH